ncbi:MAG: aspartyl/glutamyl-tRNA amidotransferase subunit B [Cenarchaeum symbiont of Oopsacas minuta]|nr:aspartyl/glutamyl-tRNA amidotransferase subunit B [Cenarchaeum symbiont of Oopsacas minuta]
MIGVEVHCHLNSLQTKLFCQCKVDYKRLEPNENICPICIGLPGSLPRLNRRAVEKATLVALALNCKIPNSVGFFRKNYFYPDLPKNYQITQLDVYGKHSIGSDGYVEVGGKRVRITRVQLEEDPGRITYEGASEKTKTVLVDYNRAGMPLVEIVTEPDFESPGHVREFLNMLSDLLENLKVSNTDMDGAMRADGNVSVGDGPKVEIKNVGSFHDLEKAIHFEIVRQSSHVDRGVKVKQETRQWSSVRKATISARKKEDDDDYRYIPEADIPYVHIGEEFCKLLYSEIPESITAKQDRYSSMGISRQVAKVLSSDQHCLELFEGAHTEKNSKEVANLITTDFMGLANTHEKRILSKINSHHLADLADAILDGKINRMLAKEALSIMHETGKSLSEIVSQENLTSISNVADLGLIIDAVLAEEVDVVETLKKNPHAINYLVGKVMKKTKSTADPETTLKLLREKTS